MIQERAHPRSRGENAGTTVPPMVTVGSSPLTRGKPDLTMEDATALGLIPAHAGKTGTVVVSQSIRAAHPRSRGENICAPMRWPGTKGSSPLTRGKRHLLADVRLMSGLIPAHAGKTPP